MKKISIICLVAVLTLSMDFNTTVWADEVDPVSSSQSDITSQSVAYPLDKLLDELKTNLPQIDEDNAEELIKAAEERLEKSEAALGKENNEIIEKAICEYAEKMNEASSIIEDAIKKQSADTESGSTAQSAVNVDTGSKSTTQSAINVNTSKLIQKLIKIQARMLEEQQKSIEVLKKIEQKLSGNAKSKIDDVIKIQTAKKEAAAKMVLIRHELNAVKKESNASEVQLKKLSKLSKSENKKQMSAAKKTLKQKKH